MLFSYFANRPDYVQLYIQRLFLLPFLGKKTTGLELGNYLHNNLPSFVFAYQNLFD